jgi:hypothetical protein
LQNSFLVFIAALALSACTNSTDVSVEPIAKVDQAQGCVGSPVKECLSLLANVITESDYNDAMHKFEHGIDVDVNGRPVSKVGTLFFLTAQQPSSLSQYISISYTPAGIVSKFEISLKSSPYNAKTQEEYSATGIYEAMRLALGSRCEIAKDPNKVYKLFENSIKPATSKAKREIQVDAFNASDSYDKTSKPVAVCGHTVTAIDIVGISTDTISDYNQSGSISGTTLSFD